MSYDLYLVDPVTKETLELAELHYLRGGHIKWEARQNFG